MLSATYQKWSIKSLEITGLNELSMYKINTFFFIKAFLSQFVVDVIQQRTPQNLVRFEITN